MSEKVGITMFHCFFCGEAIGVAMETRFDRKTGDLRKTLPKEGLLAGPDEPCDACKEKMERCCLFIEVRDGWDGESDPGPYRTGWMWGILDEGVCFVLDGNPSLRDAILQKRYGMIARSEAEAMGLSRTPKGYEGVTE